MTEVQPSARLDAAIQHYVVAVFREVMRIAAVTRRGVGAADASDIADEVAAEVLRNPEVIMARHPDPVRYARRRVRHAGISHDRRQRAQRGEGVRLYADSAGQLRPGRSYVSGDAVGPSDHELFSFVGDPFAEFEAGAAERVDATAELRRCCQGLSPAELLEVWLVDACGYSVQEVADLEGQRRETVSRRLNESRRRIRQNRAAMLEGEEAKG